MIRVSRYVIPMVAVAALGLGIAALVIALTRTDRTEPGRRVDVGVSGNFALDQPVLFPDDHLYIVKVNDGDGSSSIHAFYSVVPGFFGLEHGCEVRWEPDRTFGGTGTSEPEQHGVFSDPCGGSMFAVDGKWLFGPAPSDLDQFYVHYAPTGHDHIIVDTRLLMCSVPPQHPDVLNYCHRTLAQCAGGGGNQTTEAGRSGEPIRG